MHCPLEPARQSSLTGENIFEEDRDLFWFDLSGHLGPFPAQFEYNQWEEDFTEPTKRSKEPKGWYIQAGYFMPGVNLEPAVRYEEIVFLDDHECHI